MERPVLAVGLGTQTLNALRGESHGGLLNLLEADDRSRCLRLLFEERPGLVVMDTGAPGVEGPALCSVIREMCDVPILCLLPGDQSESLLATLEAGADSCVTKPLGGAELAARVVGLLRLGERFSGAPDGIVTVGDIAIDLAGHRASLGSAPVALTRREFDLLAVLAQRPGCVVSREELLGRVWGHEFKNDTHYLRLYVGYLRRKLEEDPRNPRHILTERGVGYRLGQIVPSPVTVHGHGDLNSAQSAEVQAAHVRADHPSGRHSQRYA